MSKDKIIIAAPIFVQKRIEKAYYDRVCKRIEAEECKECKKWAEKGEHWEIHPESTCDANRQAYRDLEILKEELTPAK